MAAVKVNKKALMITLFYSVGLAFLHWRLRPNLEALFWLGGGVLGVVFLDVAEALFRLSTSDFLQTKVSLFKNVLFQTVFIPLALFVLTSSASLFGSGLVLSIFLNMLLDQRQEMQKANNLNYWFAIIKRPIEPPTQKGYLLIMTGIFGFFSLLFLI